MTDFHWSDFAVPATLLIVFMLIALATWLLHLLFPSTRTILKTKKTVLDQSAKGNSNDETMSHVSPRP